MVVRYKQSFHRVTAVFVPEEGWKRFFPNIMALIAGGTVERYFFPPL